MFNYKRQFKRYGKSFTAIVDGQKGYYDQETGKYVPPTEPSEEIMQGIILQLNDDDLSFDEGGTLTIEDRKILIDTDKHSLTHKQKVKIDSKLYQVHRIAPYGMYSHFSKVIVKRVSTDD